VLTGQLAAGTTTLARALLDAYPFGLHVDVDAIREMVTSGLASPITWTDETTRQFDLAVRAAAGLAQVYAEAGFAVAIEGAVDPPALAAALRDAGLADRTVGVSLRPSVDVALQRNRERATKTFDTGILDDVIRRLDADLAADRLPDGWTSLDNGGEAVTDTRGRVLELARRRGLAVDHGD